MNTLVGLTILLLSCIGNAELWVILVNRRHSLRYRHSTLKRMRRLHDIGMVCHPPFILALAGLRSGGLLRGGTFFDQPAAVQGLLGVSILGVIPFLYASVRFQMRRPLSQLLETKRQIYDCLSLAESPEEQQAVRGKVISRLSSFPLNQIFQLEVNRKVIQVDSPSSHASGMRSIRLAHFSDVHLLGCPGKGFHDFVTDRLADFRPDAYVFTGDLLDRLDLLPWAEEYFAKLADVAEAYFILGNHDWHLPQEKVRRRLSETGWVDLGEATCLARFDNTLVRFAGTEAPWIGDNPVVPERAQESEDLRILLSHAPDQRDYAVANDFDIMLSGHNHGGQVVLPLIGPVYSPSCFGVKYAGGLFQHQNLLMHVSRGVAGMDPLRWNCRPEVSLLELRIAPGKRTATN